MLQISEPTLVIDREKVNRNISRMAHRARQAQVDFRPHFKTHQSKIIGRWFRDFGVSKIAVSSLRMAEKFGSDGWADVLVAIPVNINEANRINRLASRLKLGLTVECDITIALLNRTLEHPVDMYLELDTGYHRSGIWWEDQQTIDQAIERIGRSEQMTFKGFLLHAGESYTVSKNNTQISRKEILEIHDRSMEKLLRVKNAYAPAFPDLCISYGDTPTCSLADDFGPVTEIRPGNFIFYDLMMALSGVCDYGDIAIAMACPVIGMNHKRKEIAIHGGAVHFSKDAVSLDGRLVYGQLIQHSSLGWGQRIEGAFIRHLSQEHGLVQFTNEPAFRRIGIGDVLWFFPVHSCLTVDAMGAYVSLEEEVISIQDT